MSTYVNTLLLLLLFLSCVATKSKINGTYISICKTNAYPSLILSIKENGSFVYKRAYMNKDIRGEWKLKNDTLTLVSDQFDTEQNIALTPKIKYSSPHSTADIYILEKGNLIVLDSLLNKENKCFLEKVDP